VAGQGAEGDVDTTCNPAVRCGKDRWDQGIAKDLDIRVRWVKRRVEMRVDEEQRLSDDSSPEPSPSAPPFWLDRLSAAGRKRVRFLTA
jgi:hypothetical protein